MACLDVRDSALGARVSRRGKRVPERTYMYMKGMGVRERMFPGGAKRTCRAGAIHVYG